MSKQLDWSSLEGLQPKAQPQSSQQPSIDSSKQLDWSSLEGLPNYQTREYPKKENALRTTARTVAQPIIGAAEVTAPGIIAGAWQALGSGEALAEMQDWEYGNKEADLRKKFPQAPWKDEPAFNKEKYLGALQTASNMVPTVSNIASFLEKNTGLPLEARNELQKKLRLAGSAGKLKPGGLAKKGVASAVAPTVSYGLKKLGVPEQAADIVGLGLGVATPTPKFEAVSKPSGLSTRWYESLKKETKLNPAQYSRVKEAVEKDVKSLTDTLIKSESKTARAMEEFPDFNEKLNAGFEKASDLAENIEGNIRNYDVKKAYRNKINSRETKGISPDEFERAYLKESRKLYKSIPDFEDASVKQLVDQFRKNNKSFGELYEPGQSGALNRAKREALLDYNRAISDIFEKKFPDSEFNNLFKFTNKRYMERMDVENIDGFFNKIFDEKIDYKEARKFFDNNKLKKSFERTLGEEGYKDMKGIMNDFMSTEQSMKLLKKAESTGFKDVISYAKKWALSPIWAKGTAIKDIAIGTRNQLLANKKFRVTWKSALDDFKKGDFSKAQKEFIQLDAMEKSIKPIKSENVKVSDISSNIKKLQTEINETLRLQLVEDSKPYRTEPMERQVQKLYRNELTKKSEKLTREMQKEMMKLPKK